MKPTYRFAMRVYDDDYRDAHGDEIVETAVELGGGAWSARQSASLVAAGLRTRALATSQGSAKNIWGQAVVTGCGLLQVASVSSLAAYLLGIRGGITSISPDPRLALCLAAAVLFALTQRINLGWFVVLVSGIVVSGVLNARESSAVLSVTTGALFVGAWAWAVRSTPASRAFSLPTALSLVSGSLVVSKIANNPSAGIVALGLATLALGLFLVRLDPRVTAIAAAVSGWISSLMLSIVVVMGDIDRTAVAVIGGNLMVAMTLILISRHGIRHLHKDTVAGAH